MSVATPTTPGTEGPLGTTLRIGTVRSRRPNEGATKPAVVLGAEAADGGITLIAPDVEVANGDRIH